MLADCMLALLRPDPESDAIDERVGALMLASTMLMWRRSMSKGG